LIALSFMLDGKTGVKGLQIWDRSLLLDRVAAHSLIEKKRVKPVSDSKKN
jgi:hypothetical protein